jgi:hypothetical protein
MDFGSFVLCAATDDLAGQAWIVPDDSLAHLPSARWLRTELPAVEPVLRCNSLSGMLAAARGESVIVRDLLEAGADTDARNKWNYSAADWAKWPENAAEIRALLAEYGQGR